LPAFLEDPYEPFKPEIAIDRALEAITPPTAPTHDLNRTLAMGFARGDSLEALLPPDTRIETRSLVKDIQAWLGSEIPKVAKLRRVSVTDLCDVSDRALRDWKPASAKPEA
ncbi:MAG TPA: hypothetical protein PK095_03200, partial [Myxococcota bacterium]|nr:hypothetical protein [Myxococcota bacterium]